VRPGLVIDRMEQALLTAEEMRVRREGVRGGELPIPVTAPSGKPRSPLHPEPRPEGRPVFAEAGAGSSPFVAPASPATSDPDERPASDDEAPRGAPPEEVDRFSLAREFSRLLQDDGGAADG
jgi:hypothetical protein